MGEEIYEEEKVACRGTLHKNKYMLKETNKRIKLTVVLIFT